jgi:guanylate cyclase
MTQLALILILPFLLQLALGGFVNASAVILWSFFAPLGAMLMSGRRQAVRWFLAYVALVVAAQLVQPSVRLDNNLSTSTVLLFFGMNVVAVSTITFTLIHYFVGQRDAAFGMLEAEQASPRAAAQHPPRQVAAILRDNHRTIARVHESISVLFCRRRRVHPDVPGDGAGAMVALLNDVFSHFDRLAAEHGCEKIRTIGDNYMVACGVPVARADHAQALRMALGMRGYATDPALSIGRSSSAWG